MSITIVAIMTLFMSCANMRGSAVEHVPEGDSIEFIFSDFMAYVASDSEARDGDAKAASDIKFNRGVQFFLSCNTETLRILQTTPITTVGTGLNSDQCTFVRHCLAIATIKSCTESDLVMLLSSNCTSINGLYTPIEYFIVDRYGLQSCVDILLRSRKAATNTHSCYCLDEVLKRMFSVYVNPIYVDNISQWWEANQIHASVDPDFLDGGINMNFGSIIKLH